jgi:hypothetical protein
MIGAGTGGFLHTTIGRPIIAQLRQFALGSQELQVLLWGF